MRVAVIGSGGLLGNAIVRVFERRGESVLGLDLPEHDVTDRLFFGDLLADFRPEVIVNASGLGDLDWVERHPNSAFHVHVRGTAVLREAAEKTGATLVQCSCMECGSGDSVFARTRRDAERAAAEWRSHLIVRCSTLFGPVGERSRGGLVATVLQAVRRTRKFQAVDNRYCSPTYTDHLASAIHELLRQQVTGLIHIGNTGRVTPAELLEELATMTGLPLEIEPISQENLGMLASRSSDTSIAETELPDWRDALREYLESRRLGHQSQ